MIVLRRDVPAAYFRANAGAEGIGAARSQYRAWETITVTAHWLTPMDVKASHPKASILKGGRAVFNIKANSYRLVCQINYAAEVVEIRFFGSHAEYDGINAETV